MNFTAYHEAKSKYAYLFDKDTVHLRLITSKNSVTKVSVIYGDPFFWGAKENEPDSWEWKIESSSESLMVKEYQTELYDHFFISLKPTYKRMKYVFVIDDQYLYGCREFVDLNKFPDAKKNLFNFFNFPFLNEEDLFQAPSWVENQVFYSIFPERFHNGDPSTNPLDVLEWGKTDKYSNNQHFGGDLKGITKKLDYLHDLGITGLYMTPIFKAHSSHKYDTDDYFEIDPAFGTKEDLRKLVSEAHKRGIKVVLDAVFNHCGFHHPFFQDVIENGKNSKYYDCFYIIDETKPIITFPLNEDGLPDRDIFKELHKNPGLLNYRTFAFTPFMPKLKTSNPLMKEHLLEVATYWIKEFDIDGWRLDVSNEVSHQFWRDFRTAVKTVKQDAYIVGENWDNSNPWLQGEQYDGVMNYEILFPIWNYFGTNIDGWQYSGTEFANRINKVFTDYPKNILKSLYNLIDSHDTTRILEICSNDADLVKLPYLFLFSLPGAPSIYYGGEVGLSGKHDPDNRRCMIWDEKEQNKELFNYIKKLIQLRKQYPQFRSVDFKWIKSNDQLEYIIYRKEDLYFILSKRYKEQAIALPVELRNQRVKNILTNDDLQLDSELNIPHYGYYIFQVKSNS